MEFLEVSVGCVRDNNESQGVSRILNLYYKGILGVILGFLEISLGFYGVSRIMILYYWGILGVPWDILVVLTGVSGKSMSPQGYQEF